MEQTKEPTTGEVALAEAEMELKRAREKHERAKHDVVVEQIRTLLYRLSEHAPKADPLWLAALRSVISTHIRSHTDMRVQELFRGLLT